MQAKVDTHGVSMFCEKQHKTLQVDGWIVELKSLAKKLIRDVVPGGLDGSYHITKTDAELQAAGLVRPPYPDQPPIRDDYPLTVAGRKEYEDRRDLVKAFITAEDTLKTIVVLTSGKIAENMKSSIDGLDRVGVYDIIAAAKAQYGTINSVETTAVKDYLHNTPLNTTTPLVDQFANIANYEKLLRDNGVEISPSDSYAMHAKLIRSHPELADIYRNFLFTHADNAQQTTALLTSYVCKMVKTLGTSTSVSEAALSASATAASAVAATTAPPATALAAMSHSDLVARITALEAKGALKHLRKYTAFCFCCGYCGHTGSSPCFKMERDNFAVPGTWSAAMIAATKPGNVGGKPSSTAVVKGYKK